jgi:hypothetical protein
VQLESRISNLELRIPNLSSHELAPIRDSQFAIRDSFGAGGRIRTFTKPGLSRSPLPIGSRQQEIISNCESRIANLEFAAGRFAIRNSTFAIHWYRRRDSNPHQLVSKTSASARLGHAGTWQDFELRIADCESQSGRQIRNSQFDVRNSLCAVIQFSNNKRSGPFRAHSTEAVRSLSLFRNQLLRFRERESAPAGSTTAIIGELPFCRFAKAYEALAVRLHIQM